MSKIETQEQCLKKAGTRGQCFYFSDLKGVSVPCLLKRIMKLSGVSKEENLDNQNSCVNHHVNKEKKK